MITLQDTKNKYPGLVRLSNILRNSHRYVGDSVDRAYANFGDVWAAEFEHSINALYPTQELIDEAAKGYAVFVMQSMRLQAIFEREGEYKAKTYDEASSEVYLNEKYMFQQYLPGLMLSHYLWPHHYRQIQFFRTAFVRQMQIRNAQNFLEVGVGTGLYSAILLSSLPHVYGQGIDISPFSKRFTEQQLESLGYGQRYRVELRDITETLLEKKANWLICVEVLEHLERPVEFLKGLRRNMAPDAKAFITAAVNAAHTDHIYLYRNASEVLSHILEAGFNLEQSFVGVAYKPPKTDSPVPEAVAFVVY